MSAYSFNSEDVPDDDRPRSFELLPPGWYPATISDATISETRNGGGLKMTVEWTLETGRKVWQNINLENASQTAVEIGRRDLKSICEAIVLRAFADTDQLIGRGCDIRIKVDPPENGYEAKNVVADHRYPEGVAQQGPPDRGNPPPPPDDDRIPF